jgi:hypothetical protein
MDDLIVNRLEQRLGRLHAKQRLGIGKDHEAQIFGQGINFFHIENWYSIHSLIRNALKLGGMFWRGQRNAERVPSAAQIGKPSYVSHKRFALGCRRRAVGYSCSPITPWRRPCDEPIVNTIGRCCEEVLPWVPI